MENLEKRPEGLNGEINSYVDVNFDETLQSMENSTDKTFRYQC